jgi:hypothetical protein
MIMKVGVMLLVLVEGATNILDLDKDQDLNLESHFRRKDYKGFNLL